MAFYRAPADRPVLPPGYSYVLDSNRIYIKYAAGNGLNKRLCKPYSNNHQYWNKWENAALAAWQHAYEQLKKEVHA